MPIPKTVEFINKQSTKERIYNTVLQWIVQGTLMPGEKINDFELAQYFGVSRTPVREALMMLELQKLIYVIPGKATVVTSIDIVDIEKCYLPLAEIQALAIEQACDKRTNEDIEKLRSIYNKYQNSCKNNNADEAMNSDTEFHECIMDIADNEYMSDFSEILILHVNRLRYQYYNNLSLRSTSIEEHYNILEALIERDRKKASQLMRMHWLGAKDRAINKMMENGFGSTK